LKLSITALSVGLPGRLKSSWTRFQYAQWSRAFEVNSLPLSTWIVAGNPPLVPTAASRAATSCPLTRPHGEHDALAGEDVHDGQYPDRAAVGERVLHEVHRPALGRPLRQISTSGNVTELGSR